MAPVEFVSANENIKKKINKCDGRTEPVVVNHSSIKKFFIKKLFLLLPCYISIVNIFLNILTTFFK
jgi:hypothetical protein